LSYPGAFDAPLLTFDFAFGAIAKRSINFSCLIRNKSDFQNPKNRAVSLAVYEFVQKTVYQWRSMKTLFFV